MANRRKMPLDDELVLIFERHHLVTDARLLEMYDWKVSPFTVAAHRRRLGFARYRMEPKP